jgi:hypothetical protein
MIQGSLHNEISFPHERRNAGHRSAFTLLDIGSANLSNHQTNRLQKDTIYIKFYEKI